MAGGSEAAAPPSVAGPVLGELSTQVAQSCLVAGAVFGDVAVSLVMTEAAFSEICIFCGQREK